MKYDSIILLLLLGDVIAGLIKKRRASTWEINADEVIKNER